MSIQYCCLSAVHSYCSSLKYHTAASKRILQYLQYFEIPGVLGHPKFRVNPNISEYWGTRVSLVRTTGYWSITRTRYEHVPYWPEAQTGEENMWCRQTDLKRFVTIKERHLRMAGATQSSCATQLQIKHCKNGHCSEHGFQWTDFNDPDFWWTDFDEPDSRWTDFAEPDFQWTRFIESDIYWTRLIETDTYWTGFNGLEFLVNKVCPKHSTRSGPPSLPSKSAYLLDQNIPAHPCSLYSAYLLGQILRTYMKTIF